MNKIIDSYKNFFLFIILFSMVSIVSTANVLADEKNDADSLPTTGFEDRDTADWTTLEEEIEFIEEIAKRSDRVRFDQVGTSVEGRPIHLIRVGDPLLSDEEIADGRNIFVMGTPHGNEPAGREMALKLLRDLAFTDDEDIVELLNKSTVLIMPTPNPDGREANVRRNAWGIDNNRDNLNLVTPENQTIASVLNYYKPDITVDAHERPSGSTPDMQMLWPRNLNVDTELYELNVEMIQEHLRPAVENDGFTTGLYGTPGGSGGEDERILRNMGGLRHGLSLLTESAGKATNRDRVDMQMSTVKAMLNFYMERFDDIANIVDGASERKQTAYNEGDDTFYFEGADNYTENLREMEPKACGYLIHKEQAKKIERHIELFSIETEEVSENGVFVTMDQPMMTVIPFLMDERANFNEVNGLALEDCEDPGSINPPEPPEQTEPAQYETSFADDETGKPPANWSMLWRESNWGILDNPRRLEHVVDSAGGRTALVWEKVGEVYGDVEVSGLVRPSGTGDTMFQIHLHATGDATTENSYYVDLRTNGSIRINRNLGGTFSTRQSAKVPFEVKENIWYQVVFQRDGTTLNAKVWPYGEEEPSNWQVSIEDPLTNNGNVGIGHVTSGRVNEWAYFGVGTGGEQAPRAPEDMPGITSSEALKERVKEIRDENLNEDDYTPDSWNSLQQALNKADEILNNPNARQSEVVSALNALNQARSNLKAKSSAQYKTDFSEYEAGVLPRGWSMLWGNSNWKINDEPRRLTHTVEGSRQALIWDEVGEVTGDVEISGVVRANNSGDTLFQIGLHMSGEEGSENAYYLDLRRPDANGSANRFRINKYVDGKYTLLKGFDAPFTVSQDTWYEVVFKREGNTMWAKVWPYGEAEPNFQLEFTDDSLSGGAVGVAGITKGTVNDWAFIGVGTGGETAPRAPSDLFEPEEPPVVDKSVLQETVDKIKGENLDESAYTKESWRAFQTALKIAEELLALDNEKINQSIVDKALSNLEIAYEKLEEKEDEDNDENNDEDVEESS